MLPGVRVYELKKNKDERGFFSELFRTDWKEFITDDSIAQISLSKSLPGIVRAWHRHKRGQVDYITCVQGIIKVCVYDDGTQSGTKGQLDEIVIDSEKPQIIRVPGLYWHGTKGMGDGPSMTLYMVTKLYDYKNPDEERRLYNDPLIIDNRTGEPYDWNRQ